MPSKVLPSGSANGNGRGWVKIPRDITEDTIWLKGSFSPGQAWLDLVLNANHKDTSIFIRGNEIKLKRGQLAWSEVTIANRWGWSRGKVRRYFLRLKTGHYVVQQKIEKITTVTTIVGYDLLTAVQETVHQTVHQTVHRQECKEDKRKYIKEKSSTKVGKQKDIGFARSDEFYRDLSSEKYELIRQYQLDRSYVLAMVDKVEDYGKATGKKYKDYSAAVRNWIRRDIQDRPDKFTKKGKYRYDDIIK